MQHFSSGKPPSQIEHGKKHLMPKGDQHSKGDMLAKGVATAVAASTIIQTGKGVVTSIARHPLVLFSLGVAAGIIVHKYRKEISTLTSKTAEHGKDFILRQQESLKSLLAENTQEDEQTDTTE